MIAPRILGAGVVGGHDRDVGQLGRDPPHLRALVAVAVAPGAEDADHATAELTRRAQDVRERIGRVGVVDEHREWLAFVDLFETSRDRAHGLEPRARSGVVDPEQPRRRERGERVLDVEPSAQLEVDTVERARPELRVVREAERERLRKLGGEPAAVLVPDVHRCRDVLREQPALRVEVALHRAVEVEMVLREVREHERREANAVEAVQLGAVRGRLERAALVPGVEHLAKCPLQVDRLRGRAHSCAYLVPHARLDRAEQPGLPTRRLEDRVEQVRGRRLAVRARDARDLELVRGVPEELGGRGRHRPAGVLDHQLRHWRPRAAARRRAPRPPAQPRPPRSRGRPRATRERRRTTRPARPPPRRRRGHSARPERGPPRPSVRAPRSNARAASRRSSLSRDVPRS